MTERTHTGPTDFGLKTEDCCQESLNDPSNLIKGTSIFEAFGYQFDRKLIGTGDIATETNFYCQDTSSGTYVPEQNDFQVFQPDDPQHAIINTTDQDFIFTYGIQIRYYQVRPREEQTYLNETYGESANREYYGAVLERNSRFAFLTEVSPTVAYGLYAPAEMSQQMTQYSLDTSRTSLFYFNIVYIRNLLGRDPVIGDVLIPFDVPQQLYEVMQVKPANKTLYVPRRWQLTAQLVQFSL